MPFAPVASLSDYSQAPLTVYSVPAGPSAEPAVIAFICPGSWGAFFGIDTDNRLKWGGGSLGTVPGKSPIPGTLLIFGRPARPRRPGTVRPFGDPGTLIRQRKWI
ncbi:tail protein [Pseudomonas phage WP1]